MIHKRFDLKMSALLLSILGISSVIPHCPMWKAIAPCSCRMDSSKLQSIYCEKMSSFDQIVGLFHGHFAPSDRISLSIALSNLDDLSKRSFKELNTSIENLKLNQDNIGLLHADTFEGLTSVNYLSLADNSLDSVPEHLWQRMPNIKTIDLGRAKIRHLSESSFRGLPYLQVLVLPGNLISHMEKNSIPSFIHRVHLGRNLIKDLNGTLLHLTELIWLFVNSNDLTTLENELPIEAHNLKLIHAANNKIQKLPQHLETYNALESLFAQHNLVTGLDGTLSKSRKLKRLVLDNNLISTLREDEFENCELLESIMLSHNRLKSLNGSLLNLRSLNFFNVSFNLMEEFSFQEIVGLQELRSMDLSYNKITKIVGPATNLVEWNIKLTEIKLDNNELETLNGALSGLPELLRLNLSFNKLTHISPDDLIGLDQLRLLDISHNRITTLEETSKTFLPRLEELRASHNQLTILARDFHGLPVLCYADLSSNKIVALGRDLVSKTRCKVGHPVHEGMWDTLKIYLQDNPILCDAALPEITSAMEVNHTRIYGVSHCPPLSEQPVTSKPNAFLGYVPETETTPGVPAVISANIQEQNIPENRVQQISPLYDNPNYQLLPLSIQKVNYNEQTRDNANSETGLIDNKFILNNPELYIQKHPPRQTEEPAIENKGDLPEVGTQVNVLQDQPEKAITEHKNSKFDAETLGTKYVNSKDNLKINTQDEEIANERQDTSRKTVVAEMQERQINKMASEIEMLRTQIEELANQNSLLAKNINQIKSENTNQSKEQDLTS